jgi:hypothetical protein
LAKDYIVENEISMKDRRIITQSAIDFLSEWMHKRHAVTEKAK